MQRDLLEIDNPLHNDIILTKNINFQVLTIYTDIFFFIFIAILHLLIFYESFV